jgi:hypothetical protein
MKQLSNYDYDTLSRNLPLLIQSCSYDRSNVKVSNAVRVLTKLSRKLTKNYKK